MFWFFFLWKNMFNSNIIQPKFAVIFPALHVIDMHSWYSLYSWNIFAISKEKTIYFMILCYRQTFIGIFSIRAKQYVNKLFVLSFEQDWETIFVRNRVYGSSYFVTNIISVYINLHNNVQFACSLKFFIFYSLKKTVYK